MVKDSIKSDISCAIFFCQHKYNVRRNQRMSIVQNVRRASVYFDKFLHVFFFYISYHTQDHKLNCKYDQSVESMPGSQFSRASYKIRNFSGICYLNSRDCRSLED